jgi:murein tripeptide amidase MpaA
MSPIKVSHQFDSGNVEVLEAADPAAIRLAIRPDRPGSDEYMWFHFSVTGAREVECGFRIENASGTRFSPGWENYRVVASYDREDWFRVSAEYDGTALAWRHRPERDRVWYGYHAPYSEPRRMALLERCAASNRAHLEVLGATLDGRDIELVTVGESGNGKRVCWIVARQHPGETMAEFAAEALLDRLIDTADPVSYQLLERAVFYVVPNMNPDGSIRGNHRYNAGGVDLNRAWSNTTPEMSPEVWFVRECMRSTGVDFCLDIHGDEGHHYVWPVRTTGIPSLTQWQTTVGEAFDQALLRASPDYRPDLPEKNYNHAPGQDPLAMCTSWTAETFGCLSLIVELPFLDNEFISDPRNGWSPRRSGLFGRACLDALVAVVNDLR